MIDRAEQRRRLRQKITARDLVVAPGVFDLISARFADDMDFDALYMTGYGISASYLGLPDAGLATYSDMVDCVERIAGACSTPLIADGDTGYGGLLNVRHTVRGYEKAGAAAIQLEDQTFPKRCGHTLGRECIPMEDMVAKIRVAIDSRTDPNFMIIARTDARTALGLDEAIRRAKAYRDSGADIVFVESPETEAEMEQVVGALDCPLVANMVEGGRTPVLGRDRLKELGFTLAIFPATGFLATGQVLRNVYGALKRDGSTAAVQNQLDDFDSFSRTVGFEDVWEFEKRYGS
ncbi:MAG: isocitrate lyase/PEP mutase family protein [Pseudomonadota bacterium]